MTLSGIRRLGRRDEFDKEHFCRAESHRGSGEANICPGEAAVIFALLEQAKMLRELQAGMPSDLTPATPSSSVPPYQKPRPKSRPKKPGKKPGQPGQRRPRPPEFDPTHEH